VGEQDLKPVGVLLDLPAGGADAVTGIQGREQEALSFATATPAARR
jgi:hypothetical protein